MTLPGIIRTPNHLGDLIMALPALEAAPDADLVVARWLVPIIDMLGRQARVIPLDRGARGLLQAAAAIRPRRYASGVLLPPSFSSALLFRLGGVRHLRGTATDGRQPLLSDAVPVTRIRDRHRTLVYRELVTGGADGGRGAAVRLHGNGVDLSRVPRLAPRLPVPAEAHDRWAAELRRGAGGIGGAAGAGAAPGRALVGIFPGSNARSRRWDAVRFGALARALSAEGIGVLVFGAASERAITAEVAGTWGEDLGGRTDLPMLAAALSACDILVTNDSGPMHLAAAVGTRTLVVSGPADTRETAPGGTGHVYLQRLDLPCVPCVKNECPRQGAGYILREAERECLQLIEVPEVLAACLRMLEAVQ